MTIGCEAICIVRFVRHTGLNKKNLHSVCVDTHRLFLPCRSAWIMKPNSLPTSYISFLNKHGGKDLSIFKGINELLFKTKPLTALKSIEEHYRTTGVDIQLDPEMSIPCSVSTLQLVFWLYIVSNCVKI